MCPSIRTPSPPRASSGSAWVTKSPPLHPSRTRPDYPETPTHPVEEVLHGEQISDPYRWLEDGQSPETQRWTEQQNALTEAYLAGFPIRERIRARLEQLLTIGVLTAPT